MSSLVESNRVVICDQCEIEMREGTPLTSCFVCDYDLCGKCSTHVASDVSSGSGAKKSAPKKTASGGVAGKFDKRKADDKWVQSLTRDELLILKRPDLRELCKKIGIVQTGSDQDIRDRLSAKFEESPVKEATGTSDMEDDAWADADEKKETKPKSQVDTRTLNAAEFQAFGFVGGDPHKPNVVNAQAIGATSGGAASSGGPQSWPAPPALPNFNIHTPVRAPFAPSISPELAAARQRLTDVHTAIDTEKVPT